MRDSILNTDRPAAHAFASRGKILMMVIIAGAVITNIYCTQPILPPIAAGLRVGLSTVDLVAAAARVRGRSESAGPHQ